MAKKYCFFGFYTLILLLLRANLIISAYDGIVYTAFNPPGSEDDLQIYLLEQHQFDELNGLERIRREAPTEMTTPKTVQMNKPQKTTPPLPDINLNASKVGKDVTKIPNPAPPTIIPWPSLATTHLPSPPPPEWENSPELLNMTIPSETEIQITRFFDDKVLKDHNITSQQEDHHVYYNSTLMPGRGKDFWVDLDTATGTKISDTLSTAHRRAMTVKLSFDFPFYGHIIRNMTIATGGFLYTGEHVHSWLAATQYIAPLMANFDTSLSNQSYVKYLDNGTAFTVQWENVVLQENPGEGSFTFQCTLLDSGDIVFAYRNVAPYIDRIVEDQHPVKVGLSDAYIIDRTIFFIRRKTIYEYHRVDFKREDIKNWTAIVLSALDTCLDMKTCHACISEVPRFQCNWCADRCSNGLDRHRQNWLQNGCDGAKIHSFETCPATPSFQPMYDPDDEPSVGIAGVLGILFLLCVALCLGVWLFYAYKNPHTTAGQFLIRYRPSTWTWRRGEARYTAATIHM